MNSSVREFILKALFVFFVWYLVYELWLLPNGELDNWLALNIVGISEGLIKSIGYEVWSVNRIIGIGENGGIELVDGCTGISAAGLFLGFIIAYPGNWKNKFSFSLLGIGVIYFVNILRVVTLVVIQEEWITFFDITHDYSTTLIFYLVIFLLWMVWVKQVEWIPKSSSTK